MSPEIKKDGIIIANVPDKTGTYVTINGISLYVNTDQIDAHNNKQQIALDCAEIGGKRVIGLTQEGKGKSSDLKRGDGKLPEIDVVLNDRPIRVSYTRVQHERYRPHGWGLWGEPSRTIKTVRKETYRNPNWRNGYRGR